MFQKIMINYDIYVRINKQNNSPPKKIIFFIKMEKKKQNQNQNKPLQKPTQMKITDYVHKSITAQSKQQNISKSKQNNSDISCKTEVIPEPLYNVQFYSNRIKSIPSGDFIDNIHENWYDNFSLLQEHHGYIQWIFPNKFKSRFNDHSHAISQKQIPRFLNDEKIYNRYIKSYQMMLNFYGIKMKSKLTGELTRSRNPNFKERFQKTLLTRYHNHMRITRILSSLTLLGFSQYAKNLAYFLQYEIYAEEGNLKDLRTIKVYERQWKQFECIDLQKQTRSKFFESKKSKQFVKQQIAKKV